MQTRKFVVILSRINQINVGPKFEKNLIYHKLDFRKIVFKERIDQANPSSSFISRQRMKQQKINVVLQSKKHTKLRKKDKGGQFKAVP